MNDTYDPEKPTSREQSIKEIEKRVSDSALVCITRAEFTLLREPVYENRPSACMCMWLV